MNKYLRLFLILSHIGGGFAGMSVVISALGSAQSAPAVMWLGVFALIFIFGIVGGYFLIEDRPVAIWLSLIYHAFQIPILSGKPELFLLNAGFAVNAEIVRWKLVLSGLIGTRFQVTLHHGFSGLGVNLFALAMFMTLLNIIKRQRAEKERMALEQAKRTPEHNFTWNAPPGVDERSM